MKVDVSQVAIPFISDEGLRAKADEIRNNYWNNTLPVDIELVCERDLGLDLIPIQSLKLITSSDAILLSNLKEIVYDDSVPEVRIRFTIAHEVGHLILHKEIIEKIQCKSFDEWTEKINNLPGGLWGRAELQANEFAGRLLVPRKELIDSLNELKPQIEEAAKILNGEILSLNEFLAPQISRKFNVSESVIKIRLEREKINPYEVLKEN